MGELNTPSAINVIVSPQWLELRGVLVAALRPYPDASLAVAGAIASLERQDGKAR
jgi:hypothetical protein